jgi:hypothetical protein
LPVSSTPELQSARNLLQFIASVNWSGFDRGARSFLTSFLSGVFFELLVKAKTTLVECTRSLSKSTNLPTWPFGALGYCVLILGN